MRSNGLLAASVFGIAVLAAGNAEATLLFEIDGVGSSVSVVSSPAVGTGITGSLVAGLDGTSFSLDEGQSFSFDFLRLSGVGIGGAGTYAIDASLAFAAPTGTPAAGGDGGGLYAHFMRVLSAGTLTWTNQPGLITLLDGSVIEVLFEGGAGIQVGSPVVRATVRLVDEAASVPEPATLGLLGIGTAGLGFGLRQRGRNVAAGKLAA